MKKICSSIVLLCLSTSYLYAQHNCKLKKDQDSIKVYTCHTDTSQFKSILAEFTINTSFEILERVIIDVPGYTLWQYNTVEAEVIKNISGSEKIYHTVIEAPWPVADRDMVVDLKIIRDHLNQEMTIITESKSGILAPKEQFVRVPASHGIWIIKQINRKSLQVKYTMQIDPGGSVPVWLVNWVCAQAPYQSFKNLKRILEKGIN